MEKIARFIKQLKNIVKVRVLSYHNYAVSKYIALDKENTMPNLMPTREEIDKVVEIIKNITNFEVGT
jgi:pyruvate-formate lyase-activating enzyme